jgi:bifunctional ADP-heptose synthase (sugar kinase/adenylyltransferase)
LIDQVQPDVLVKGGDYLAEEIVGYQTVTTKGGTVKVLPFLEGHSTTNIIKKIKEQG